MTPGDRTVEELQGARKIVREYAAGVLARIRIVPASKAAPPPVDPSPPPPLPTPEPPAPAAPLPAPEPPIVARFVDEAPEPGRREVVVEPIPPLAPLPEPPAPVEPEPVVVAEPERVPEPPAPVEPEPVVEAEPERVPEPPAPVEPEPVVEAEPVRGPEPQAPAEPVPVVAAEPVRGPEPQAPVHARFAEEPELAGATNVVLEEIAEPLPLALSPRAVPLVFTEPEPLPAAAGASESIQPAEPVEAPMEARSEIPVRFEILAYEIVPAREAEPAPVEALPEPAPPAPVEMPSELEPVPPVVEAPAEAPPAEPVDRVEIVVEPAPAQPEAVEVPVEPATMRPPYVAIVPDVDERVDALLAREDAPLKRRKRAPIPAPAFEPLGREPWEERLERALQNA